MFLVKSFVLLELQLLNLLEVKSELHIQSCGNKPAKLVFPVVHLEPCWFLNFCKVPRRNFLEHICGNFQLLIHLFKLLILSFGILTRNPASIWFDYFSSLNVYLSCCQTSMSHRYFLIMCNGCSSPHHNWNN